MAVARKISADVVGVRSYSEGVREFFLRPSNTRFRFKPGQFLHLAMDPYDPSTNWPESRVFSIANSPNSLEQLSIIVSQKGCFTQRMFGQLKEGDEVWIKLPYGDFNFDSSLTEDSVLIAGGTGISPFKSFLEYAIGKNIDPCIHLSYGVRTPELIIIEALIKKAEARLSNFSYEIYVEKMAKGKKGIKLLEGILPVEQIIQRSMSYKNPVYYLSGPPGMIKSFEEALKNSNINSNRVKYDNWE